jgi:hypothetical protein
LRFRLPAWRRCLSKRRATTAAPCAPCRCRWR